MKLASYRDGSRDGQLVVVSRDLSTAHYASGVAMTLQQALDDWNFIAPQLQDLSVTLNHGKARHAFPFEPRQCMAPLPRAGMRVEAMAYPSHLEHLRGEGAAADVRPWLAAGDASLAQGPCDPLLPPPAGLALDAAGELAVVCAALPQGCGTVRALEGVRLLMLDAAVNLRPAEGEPTWPPTADEMLRLRPTTLHAPVAVTPDELGPAWRDGRLHLPLHVVLNGRRLGLCDAGAAMRHGFGELLAALAQTRAVRGGTVLASGPVSQPASVQGRRASWPKGFACLAEKRAIETRQDGQPATPYLQPGDQMRLEIKDAQGQSVFGAIEVARLP